MLTRHRCTRCSASPVEAPGSGFGASRRFIVVDYERALPIAPGVVLVRAPGLRRSQIVYVKLASGRS